MPTISFILFFHDECNVSESINNPMVNVRSGILKSLALLQRQIKDVLAQSALHFLNGIKRGTKVGSHISRLQEEFMYGTGVAK